MKQRFSKIWENSNIWTAALCVAALLFTVIPMMYITRYVWPCADDYVFSRGPHGALMETGNFWGAIKSAWDCVAWNYAEWQGTYSAIFLMALQPGIWGEQYYALGLLFIFVSLYAGVFCLSYIIMVKHGKAPKSVWLTITSLLMFAWLLRVMYPSEAFYWWNGASYYIGYHSWAMLIIAALLCFYCDWHRYGKGRKSFFYITGVLIGLFMGGGNYPTALMLILIMGGLAVSSYIYHKPALRIIIIYALSTLAGLLISVLAPGNTRHMNHDFEHNVSATEAIFISIKDGLRYISDWTNISVVMLFVFLLPFIWQLVKSSGWKFKYPILATILSGGLYLAGFAPVSYAFGGYAPGRMINLYYLNYYFLLLFNVIYWVGWIYNKIEAKNICINRRKWQPVYVCIAGVLFLLSVAKTGITNTNLYWVYLELYNGYYTEVDQFMAERIAYFEEHPDEDIIVEPVPYKSVLTYFGDVFPDKEHVANVGVAEYYGLKSISLQEK